MKSRFLTFACAAFVVAVNAVCAAGDSVPDMISRSGVAIDFSQQEPSLMIESGTSLQKVASVASDWVEKYVRPHVEEGTVSKRDFYLLAFSLEVADYQAEMLRRWAESEMGLTGIDLGGAIPDVWFADQKYSSETFRSKLMYCESPIDVSQFESYCRAYNYKNREGAFVSPAGIQKALNEWREMERKGSQEIQVLSADPDVYVAGKQIRDMKPGFWRSLVHWNPWYWKENRWAWDDIDKTDRNVRDLVDRLDKRKAYLNVFDSPEGFYQKAYMNLARTCHLVEVWRAGGWRSSVGMTDHGKYELEAWHEKICERSRGTLTHLEDTLVNYPLMCNLLESTSVCLHVNVLEADERNYHGPRKNWKKETAEKVRGLRSYWLANCKKVGDLCSEYSKYSMMFMTANEAMKYNFYLGQAYATNRLANIWKKSEEDVQGHLKNSPPLYDQKDEIAVKDGCVTLKRDVEYCQLADAYLALSKNELLKELVALTILKDIESGNALVNDWMSDMKMRFLAQRWMYPSWSKEAQDLGTPMYSEEIVEQVEICQSAKRVVEKMQLVLRAVRCISPDVEPVERIFKEQCASEESLEGAKKKMLSFIKRKKLPNEFDLGGFVDQLFSILDVQFETENEGLQPPLPKSMSEIADALAQDYIPRMKEIDSAKWRFGRWFF